MGIKNMGLNDRNRFFDGLKKRYLKRLRVGNVRYPKEKML